MNFISTLKSPAKWSLAWNAYWFGPSLVTRLAVMRLIVVGLQLTQFRRSLDSHLNLANVNDHFVDPQILIRLITTVIPEDVFRTSASLTGMYAVMIVAGAISLVGLFGRMPVFLFGFLNLLFISHGYSYGEEHHPEALFSAFIILLGFSPCTAALSLDAIFAQRRAAKHGLDVSGHWGLSAKRFDAHWAILLTQWLLVLAYLFAGLAKMKRGGIHWFNGTTLQTYLLMDGMRWDRPLGLWMAKHKTLCILSSIGAVGLELFFWVAVVFKKIAPLFIIAGMSMHIGIYIMQAAPFWQFLVLYLLWVPWERLPGLRPGDAGGLPSAA